MSQIPESLRESYASGRATGASIASSRRYSYRSTNLTILWPCSTGERLRQRIWRWPASIATARKAPTCPRWIRRRDSLFHYSIPGVINGASIFSWMDLASWAAPRSAAPRSSCSKSTISGVCVCERSSNESGAIPERVKTGKECARLLSACGKPG